MEQEETGVHTLVVCPGSVNKTPPQFKRFLTVEIANEPIEVLVDSGAQVSVLRKITFDRLPGHIRNDLNEYVATVAGATGIGDTVGTIELPVRLAGGCYSEIFWIIDKGTVDILGDTYLKPMGASIDCGTDVMTIRDKCFMLNNQGGSEIRDGCSHEIFSVDMITSPFVLESEFNLGPDLTDEQKREVKELLYQKKVVWEDPKLGQCNVAEFEIDTGDASPITCRMAARSLSDESVIEDTVQNLKKMEALNEGSGQWVSNPVVADKKGGKRVCINYAPLNKITKKDRFPLP